MGIPWLSHIAATTSKYLFAFLKFAVNMDLLYSILPLTFSPPGILCIHLCCVWLVSVPAPCGLVYHTNLHSLGGHLCCFQGFAGVNSADVSPGQVWNFAASGVAHSCGASKILSCFCLPMLERKAFI